MNKYPKLIHKSIQKTYVCTHSPWSDSTLRSTLWHTSRPWRACSRNRIGLLSWKSTFSGIYPLLLGKDRNYRRHTWLLDIWILSKRLDMSHIPCIQQVGTLSPTWTHPLWKENPLKVRLLQFWKIIVIYLILLLINFSRSLFSKLLPIRTVF